MKQFILLSIVVAGIGLGAQAQDSSSVKHRQMHHGMEASKNSMYEELNLTDAQKASMEKMRADNKVKIEAIQNNSSLTDDQKKEQMRALRLEQHKQMQNVLTDEQKATMQEMRSKRMEENKMRRKGIDSTQKK